MKDIDQGRGEMTFWIGQDRWNKGIATEAARLMIDFSFRKMKLHKVFSSAAVPNIAAQRVLQKCAMQPEGRLREHRLIAGKYCDCIYYGILREEYLALKDWPR